MHLLIQLCFFCWNSEKSQYCNLLHIKYTFLRMCNELTTFMQARTDVSKTLWTPSRVKAEHSTYATAFILLATSCPTSNPTGVWLIKANVSTNMGSSLKSILFPQRTMGTSGQKWLHSGPHFSITFWSESGLSTEKQMRRTSVSG